MTPVLSVIVLNYNGRRWLDGCLMALRGQRGAPPFETILVDNGSSDGSAAHVREVHTDVRVLETGGNLGFAAGNNAGAAIARGSVLVFLNNDTIPEPDWLGRLSGALQARDVGFVTSRIVFMDDPARIDSAGDGYLLAGGAFKHGHGAAASAHAESREVFGACGAAFAIRREIFEQLGGFDERFFMVYEDVDLSYRARLAGHRCWYEASAVVRHAGSGTLGRRSAAAVFYGQRNLEWTWLKNTPWPAILTAAPAHALYSAAGLAHYAASGLGGAALLGKLSALAGVWPVLRARRAVQRSQRIDTAALRGTMTRGWLRLKRREKR